MKTLFFDSLADITNTELVARVKKLVRDERESTASLVAHLSELGARRLYLDEGCSSLFTYCTEVLHLSEQAAYRRIRAARASRRFPLILEKLRDGSIHLSAVALLAPHLTARNHRQLLDAAGHRSKREVEGLVALLRPLPSIPSSIRRVSSRAVAPAPWGTGFDPDSEVNADDPDQGLLSGLETPGRKAPARPAASGFNAAGSPASGSDAAGSPASGSNAAGSPASGSNAAGSPASGSDVPAFHSGAPTAPPGRCAKITTLAPNLYSVQFTVTDATHLKFRQAQELLRHRIPSGDPAEIFDLALTVLLKGIRRRKFAERVQGESGPSTGDEPAAKGSPESAHPGTGGEAAGGEAPGGGTDRAPVRDTPISRTIPANVRRQVWDRDGGRCAFRGRNGRRCTERGFLEFHHVTPFAAGGPPTVENLELRCRAHNRREAERFFGYEWPPEVREAAPRYFGGATRGGRRPGRPDPARRGPELAPGRVVIKSRGARFPDHPDA